MDKFVSIIGLNGIPEVSETTDLVSEVLIAAKKQNTPISDGDILVVTQKVVSKSEGRVENLNDIEPSSFALDYAAKWDKDARLVELVLRESVRIVRMDNGILITETTHGFICANSGIDASNAGTNQTVVLLPINPDSSAAEIKKGVLQNSGKNVAVIISDTFGRPWREGAINIAIGASGIEPLVDYRGDFDPDGRQLESTTIAVVDEIAAASELVTHKLGRVPVSIVRGYSYTPSQNGIQAIIRDSTKDLFR